MRKFTRILRAHSPFYGVTAAALLATFGCGDDTGLPTRYPVSGTVFYNGQAVQKGQISFIAADKNAQRDANGFIQDGKYTLTTSIPSDGAIPGEYGVVVTAKEVDESKILETISKQGGGARQHEVAKATGKAKNLVPAKYQLAETSKIKVKVEPKSNDIKIDLTD